MEDGGRKVFAFLKRKQSGCEVVSMGLPQSVGSEQDRKHFCPMLFNGIGPATWGR